MPNDNVLTSDARATIMDACQSISRSADDLKDCHTVDGDWGDDLDAKAIYDAELNLLGRLTALLGHPGQPEPHAEETLFADSDERDEFIRACQDFDDDGETCVDYGLLMKWAVAGLLDCDHFTITKKGRAAIDAARAGGA